MSINYLIEFFGNWTCGNGWFCKCQMLANTCLHPSFCPQLQHLICLEYDLIKRRVQRSAVSFHCLVLGFFMEAECPESSLSMAIKHLNFPCLAFAISWGGIFCHMGGANKSCKSFFRTLIYKIFTPQSYHSTVELQMKWKMFRHNKTQWSN